MDDARGPHDRSLDPAASAAAVFARAVDRAVLRGWIGRGLAMLGAWSAVTTLLLAAAAVVELAGGGRAPAGMRVAVIIAAAGILAAMILRQSLGPGQRPSRLGVALATESQHPRLGERLSRAVDFLADAAFDADETSGVATTGSFRRLAIEQAAEALRDNGPLRIPGMARDLCWTAAGMLGPAALWLSAVVFPPAWAHAVRGQLPRSAGPHQPAATAGPLRVAGAVPTPPSASEPLSIAEAMRFAWQRVEAIRTAIPRLDLPDDPQRSSLLLSLAQAAAEAADASRRSLAAHANAGDACVLTIFAAQLADVAHDLGGLTPDDPAASARLSHARISLDSLSRGAHSAARIAEVASLQTKLAGVLIGLFARAPGLPAAALPHAARDRLERLAIIQAECLRAIVPDRLELEAAARTAGPAGAGLRRVTETLMALDLTAAAAAPAQIMANRLAVAADAVAETAQVLTDAAVSFGMPTTGAALLSENSDRLPVVDGSGGPAGLRSRDAAVLARADSLLDELSGAQQAQPAGRPNGAGGEETTAAAAARDDGGGRMADSNTQGAGGDAVAATTDPRQGAGGGSVDASAPRLAATIAVHPIEQVWQRLPAHDRFQTSREAVAELPATYRPAIDSYYRLLLESMPDTPATPPEKPRRSAGQADRP